MNWRDLTFVSFDTETTGRYPLTAEICEIAAVKWKNGQEVGTFATLLKPSKPMTIDNIQIHGISNQMVENAPLIKDKIAEFHSFVQGCVLIAHHAPFDLGFVAVEFEKAGLSLPDLPVICSSLLSRNVISETPDHRLQTLVQHFKIDGGQAHRALDDARACLHVTIRCLQRMEDALNGVSQTGQLSFDVAAVAAETTAAPKSLTLDSILQRQGGELGWARFSMQALRSSPVGQALIDATLSQSNFEMVYAGGSNPGAIRFVKSDGLVRSLDGDFIAAYELDHRGQPLERRSKRFYIDKIASVNFKKDF
jgi:DNA polymerase III subunit epsilon